MTVFLVDDVLLTSAEEVFAEHHEILAMAYGSAVRAHILPAAAYIFTGLLWSPRDRIKLAVLLEEALVRNGMPVFNRPSALRNTIEIINSIGGRAFSPFDTLRETVFPLVLRSEARGQVAESPPLATESELREAITTAVLSGQNLAATHAVQVLEDIEGRSPLDYGFAVKIGGQVLASPLQTQHGWHGGSELSTHQPPIAEIESWFAKTHLDVGSIAYSIIGGSKAVWRIDDGPYSAFASPDIQPVESVVALGASIRGPEFKLDPYLSRESVKAALAPGN